MEHWAVRQPNRVDTRDQGKSPNRRLLALHGMHLTGRCMRAQQRAITEVKCIVHCPGGMVRRNIQRFKIVIVVLYLRPMTIS